MGIDGLAPLLSLSAFLLFFSKIDSRTSGLGLFDDCEKRLSKTFVNERVQLACWQQEGEPAHVHN